MEHAPRHPNHPLVFADLDPELHRLPLGIPEDIFWKSEKHLVLSEVPDGATRLTDQGDRALARPVSRETRILFVYKKGCRAARRIVSTNRQAKAHSEAPKGLFVVPDELYGWITGMGSYNDAGPSFWLERYGGRPYRVERQKLAQPIVVPRLGVAVFGGTQPDKIAADERARRRIIGAAFYARGLTRWNSILGTERPASPGR